MIPNEARTAEQRLADVLQSARNRSGDCDRWDGKRCSDVAEKPSDWCTSCLLAVLSAEIATLRQSLQRRIRDE